MKRIVSLLALVLSFAAFANEPATTKVEEKSASSSMKEEKAPDTAASADKAKASKKGSAAKKDAAKKDAAKE